MQGKIVVDAFGWNQRRLIFEFCHQANALIERCSAGNYKISNEKRRSSQRSKQ
jgi:hypothetical protein